MKHHTVSAVLDASVIYALINQEPSNFKDEMLDHCTSTTYNIAEVVNKMLLKRQANHADTWLIVKSIIVHPYSIDMEISKIATQLSTIIDHSYGLSLGDKYCIALGILLNKPIYTADRIWKKLEDQLDITVNLIR